MTMDEDEAQMFCEEGDKLIESYDTYFSSLKNLIIENPEVKATIENYIEVVSNNVRMLNRIMDELAELEDEIMADIDHPYLQSMDAIRKIKEYLKKKQQEYIIRISNDAKLKEALYKIADKYEDYERELKEKGIVAREIGPKERAEIQKKEVVSDDKIMEDLAKLICDYTSIKEDMTIDKKRFRLEMVKKKVRALGNLDWINKEFEKYTGDMI
jgi:phage-related minor tail protein